MAACCAEAEPRRRKLPGQRALGHGVARIKLPHLGVEQSAEEQTRIRHSEFAIRHCGDPSPPFAFLAAHNRPTNGLGVGENPGLDGFVFSGCGHALLIWVRTLAMAHRSPALRAPLAPHQRGVG